MHALPAYIEDVEIEISCRSLGTIVPNYRRFYLGTTIAEGTPSAKFKLPENMTLPPYTMNFKKDYRITGNFYCFDFLQSLVKIGRFEFLRVTFLRIGYVLKIKIIRGKKYWP